jgi:hypothetical protein
MTWDDFNNLTAAQKTKAAQFAAIGNALRPGAPPPDTSMVTYSQAKAALALVQDIKDLVEPALRGAQYVRTVGQNQAVASFDQANP